MTMESNANAELSMRVKALEADVAALQRRLREAEESITQLASITRLLTDAAKR